ncbi:JAB domain-containing protein [Limosilactobacillus mucosae]|uniref:JAB domain-containing protein n=2 Tax=Limosilactobacillus mucosae TaxID=97478 RepID=A0AAJ1HSX5_LIMMU|nr:JAB domain-containing protein [Limosilactobacillus mucosae]MDC2828932.1 JAB domain-containing protein [Limosilactobacillus mucosae]
MNDLIKEKTPLAKLTNAELLEELLLTVQSEPRAQKNAAKLGDASMVNFVDDDWRTNEFDLTPKQQRFLDMVKEVSKRYTAQQSAPTSYAYGSETIGRYYSRKLRSLKQEHLIVLALDTKLGIIRETVVAKGDFSECTSSPRIIFKAALEAGGSSIILLHNHPSGNCEPSPADDKTTERVAACGKILGISLLDHIVVGDDYYSYAENDNCALVANNR